MKRMAIIITLEIRVYLTHNQAMRAHNGAFPKPKAFLHRQREVRQTRRWGIGQSRLR